MTPEEQKHVNWECYRLPTNHNHTRRARCHNYSAPGTYMITIVVSRRQRLLGQLRTGPLPKVCLSDLGKKILDEEFCKITKFYPMVHVWETCIMPDHIHMILHVDEKLPANKHLGHVIGGFKGGCSRAYWALGSLDEQKHPLFEDDYNDNILMDSGQLDRWKAYLRDNPRRLALKVTNPDLFKIWHNVTIGDWGCQMIGNIFLPNIPDIMAVIVHRADSDADYAAKVSAWLACGERGGVLVSAAIAEREKLVMRQAMTRGYRLIVLRENGFHKYYKPHGESFDACVRGLMLQVCPWDYHHQRHTITRGQCLELNALALCISGGR